MASPRSEPFPPHRNASPVNEVSQPAVANPLLGLARAWGAGAGRLVLSPRERHWTNSLTLWLVLNAFDSAVTWYTLSLGGYEANPVLRLASYAHGDAVMLAVKMALALLIGLLVWRRGSRRLRGTLNLGMSLVVIANCAMLLQRVWQGGL
jgi:hypothetical protein